MRIHLALVWVILALFAMIGSYPKISQSQPNVDVCDAQASPGAVTSFSTDNCTVSGTDVVLLACIHSEGDTTNQDPTSVTWNGTEEFTLIGQQDEDTPTSSTRGWWALVNPTQTTENVDLTTADAVTTVIHVLIVTGAKQAIPTLFEPATCANCATVSGDLTTTVDNTLMLTCAGNSAGGDTYTHGDGQQELTDLGNPSGNGLSSSTSAEVQPVAGIETLSSTASAVRLVTNMVMTGVEPAVVPQGRRRRAPWSFR